MGNKKTRRISIRWQEEPPHGDGPAEKGRPGGEDQETCGVEVWVEPCHNFGGKQGGATRSLPPALPSQPHNKKTRRTSIRWQATSRHNSTTTQMCAGSGAVASWASSLNT